MNFFLAIIEFLDKVNPQVQIALLKLITDFNGLLSDGLTDHEKNELADSIGDFIRKLRVQWPEYGPFFVGVDKFLDGLGDVLEKPKQNYPSIVKGFGHLMTGVAELLEEGQGKNGN